MAENTKIEWATHTWNPWVGCTRVSPACDHCYAAELMETRYGKAKWGAGEERVRTGRDAWRLPVRLDKAAAAVGRIDTVFCLSLGDFWDNEVDPAWRAEALDRMSRTPNLVYLILSKRIGNARRMAAEAMGSSTLPRNVALGATMVDQIEWDRDAGKLAEACAALGALFSFASVEPMLGPVDPRLNLPDWVIAGGESGGGARIVEERWVRQLRDATLEGGSAFLFKQWGSWGFAADGSRRRMAKAAAGRMLDGREHLEFPVALSTYTRMAA